MLFRNLVVSHVLQGIVVPRFQKRFEAQENVSFRHKEISFVLFATLNVLSSHHTRGHQLCYLNTNNHVCNKQEEKELERQQSGSAN